MLNWPLPKPSATVPAAPAPVNVPNPLSFGMFAGSVEINALLNRQVFFCTVTRAAGAPVAFELLFEEQMGTTLHENVSGFDFGRNRARGVFEGKSELFSEIA